MHGVSLPLVFFPGFFFLVSFYPGYKVSSFAVAGANALQACVSWCPAACCVGDCQQMSWEVLWTPWTAENFSAQGEPVKHAIFEGLIYFFDVLVFTVELFSVAFTGQLTAFLDTRWSAMSC